MAYKNKEKKKEYNMKYAREHYKQKKERINKRCLDCNKLLSPNSVVYCHSCSKKGDRHYLFKERMIDKNGYIKIHTKGDHPFAHKTKQILEHRYIMEGWLKENLTDSPFLVEINGNRYLRPEIIVNHINNIKSDNRIENLECLPNSGENRSHWLLLQKIKELEEEVKILKDKMEEMKNGRIIENKY